MNLNKKGYTLIELLAVILIIGLILVLSTYGIIKAVKSSKEKVTTLSEKSIKEILLIKRINIFVLLLKNL